MSTSVTLNAICDKSTRKHPCLEASSANSLSHASRPSHCCTGSTLHMWWTRSTSRTTRRPRRWAAGSRGLAECSVMCDTPRLCLASAPRRPRKSAFGDSSTLHWLVHTTRTKPLLCGGTPCRPYITSAQRAESDAAPFMWCAVRRKGVAVLTVADRLHAAHFIVALGCCTVDETSRPHR